MTMIHFAPKQSRNGMLCPLTSKFQTSTIGYYAIPAGKTATQDSEIGSWKAERIRAVFVIGMDTLVQDFVN